MSVLVGTGVEDSCIVGTHLLCVIIPCQRILPPVGPITLAALAESIETVAAQGESHYTWQHKECCLCDTGTEIVVPGHQLPSFWIRTAEEHVVRDVCVV